MTNIANAKKMLLDEFSTRVQTKRAEWDCFLRLYNRNDCASSVNSFLTRSMRTLTEQRL